MGKPFTVLFQGDSVTDCGRIKGDVGFKNNGLGAGYPGMAAARLLCDRPEIDWTFLNRGISGNRIVDLYARWKIDTLSLKPDLLSILVGANDSCHRFGDVDNGVEVPRAERIYRELLTWTKDALPNVKLILLEPFSSEAGADPKECRDEIAERGKFTRKLASEFGAAFIPCQSFLDDALKRAEPKYWLIDGIHPTPAGHQLIADHWLQAAAPFLP